MRPFLGFAELGYLMPFNLMKYKARLPSIGQNNINTKSKIPPSKMSSGSVSVSCKDFHRCGLQTLCKCRGILQVTGRAKQHVSQYQICELRFCQQQAQAKSEILIPLMAHLAERKSRTNNSENPPVEGFTFMALRRTSIHSAAMHQLNLILRAAPCLALYVYPPSRPIIAFRYLLA